MKDDKGAPQMTRKRLPSQRDSRVCQHPEDCVHANLGPGGGCSRCNCPTKVEAGVPVPTGGFRTNDDEARWLEQTICLRAKQMMLAAGINADIRPTGLYDLLLMSLDAAGRRAKGAERA